MFLNGLGVSGVFNEQAFVVARSGISNLTLHAWLDAFKHDKIFFVGGNLGEGTFGHEAILRAIAFNHHISVASCF